MSEVFIKRKNVPAGHFAQVFLRSAESDLFTGFTLLNSEPLPDEEVVARWMATNIVVECELRVENNYSFPNLDLRWLTAEWGAEEIVCEPKGWDEREAVFLTILRVVRSGYMPESDHEGYAS